MSFSYVRHLFFMYNKTGSDIMRVFIGIEFPKSLMNDFAYLKTMLEPQLIKGRWTRVENLHLTLVFIGDVSQDQVETLGMILDQVLANQHAFELTFAELGTFPKGQQTILWLGLLDENKLLTNLSNKLRRELSNRHIDFDHKPLKPHLTLVRQATLQSDVILPHVSINQPWYVDKLHVYLSHQVNGILTYEPLHTVYLK